MASASRHLDGLAIDGDGILTGDNLIAAVVALRGIVLQQVSEHIGEVRSLIATISSPHDRTSDGMPDDRCDEAVDSNLYCHACFG